MEQMIPKILDLDEIDQQIMDIMQKNPDITHTRLAELLNRSQPAIGARVKRMKENGLLVNTTGIDFFHPQIAQVLKLMMVLINTEDVDAIFRIAEDCPYVINALKSSAVNNVVVFLACSSIKRLDQIIDQHFRCKSYVRRVEANIIMDISHQLIFPVNLIVEKYIDVEDRCIGKEEAAAEADKKTQKEVLILSAVKPGKKKLEL